MRAPFVSPLLLSLSLLLPCGVGCSNSMASEDLNSNGSAGGAVGGQPNGDLPTSLKFVMLPEALPALAARAQVTLTVSAQPPKRYHVRFALPTSGGDPLDAVLDASEIDTNADGIASVQLTAPSTPTMFDVRASVGSVSDSLAINVKDTGFATIQVQPRYPTRLRNIPTWLATAHPGKSCGDVPGIPPADGPLQALPSANTEAPVITQVPANTPLAITLRSGHFVGGCTSVDEVAPGPADQPQTVEVTVLDRPIDLTASPLNLTFGRPASETTLSESLAATGDAVLEALGGTSVDDVDGLLDAMRDASGDSRQVFENTRKTEGWDARLRAHWGPTAATKVRDIVGAWLLAGRQRFNASEHLFNGTLDPIAQPAQPAAQAGAELTLRTVAGLEGAKSGFIDLAQVSWSASSDDTVVLATDLYFVASKLAEALAEAAALQDHPDETAVAPVLAQAIDCGGIGTMLAAAGPTPGVAYAGCNADCIAELCSSAVAAMWHRGGDATALTPTRLSIAASGTAYVGDTAEIVGIRGSWLGHLDSQEADTTDGDLTAVRVTVD